LTGYIAFSLSANRVEPLRAKMAISERQMQFAFQTEDASIHIHEYLEKLN
jgi:hypothetical protein